MKVMSIEKNGKSREILLLDENEKRIRRELKDKLNSQVSFPSCVYSFVKNKCAKQASQDAKSQVKNYKYFFKCDIKNYYGSMNLDTLVKCLNKLYLEENLIKDIEKCLKEEKDNCGINGLSIGSPLSNALANIYFIEFDRRFSRREDLKYYRFCDDMLFLSDEDLSEDVRRELKGYNLEINESKTFSGLCSEGFKFLGVNIKSESIEGYNIPFVNYNFDNEIDGLLERLLNKFSDEEYKAFIKLLLKKPVSEIKKIDILKRLTGKIDVLYEYIFKFIVLRENKEELMEDLVNLHNYKAAIKFENLIGDYKNEFINYEKIRELFMIRDGEYYVSNIGEKKNYEKVENFLTDKSLDKHINGELSIAVRLDRQDDRSSVIVFDIDDEKDEDALAKADLISSALEEKNLKVYTENSGKKGYHVWIFFKENIQIKKLNDFADKILELLNLKEIEIIPKYNYLAETQNIIKLPFGIHPETRNPSKFININSVEDIVENDFREDAEIFRVFFDKLEQEFNDAFQVISKCTIVRKIIEQGFSSRNMGHFHRLVLLYVFGHIEEGREFIHFIMKEMNNYSYNITEKNMDKTPEKPISCKKLMEYFKGTELVTGCNCRFNLPEGAYNSPVMYSNKGSYLENFTKSTVKETLEEILKLKLERTELDKKIKGLEKKLNCIFDEIEEEALEINMGVLKRNKEDGKVNWTITLDIRG